MKCVKRTGSRSDYLGASQTQLLLYSSVSINPSVLPGSPMGPGAPRGPGKPANIVSMTVEANCGSPSVLARKRGETSLHLLNYEMHVTVFCALW